jgi:ApaLI-like restriction endonuclease
MSIKEEIIKLSQEQSKKLAEKMAEREEEMKEDDNSHFLIYKVLGVGEEDGIQIDLYQNKGRFLYKYAGAFLEKAAVLCFQERFPDAKRTKIDNPFGEKPKPKKFEIDCLIEKDAIEIKWRDATTDGDHVTKEHTRLQAIAKHGYKPIRIMFYQPNREQAIKIQATLKTVYDGIGGEYYSQEDAWNYVKNRTDIDLKAMLIEIAEENFPKK